MRWTGAGWIGRGVAGATGGGGTVLEDQQEGDRQEGSGLGDQNSRSSEKTHENPQRRGNDIHTFVTSIRKFQGDLRDES
jgi:hypothetical protein